MAAPAAPTLKNATADPATYTISVGWENHAPYTVISVEKNQNGGSWGVAKMYYDGREAWDDRQCSPNTTYGYRVRGYVPGDEWSAFSNIIYRTMWEGTIGDVIELDESTSDNSEIGDIATDTITLAESASGTGVFSDSAKDTIALIDDVGDIHTLTLETDYGYYFGGFDGKIYHESEGYESDNGTAIGAIWYSKVTDFSDIDPEAISRFKTVYKARLFYVDKTAGTEVTFSVSNDGGTTWTPVSRNIGTGDGTTKSIEFFFIKTGDVFQFRIEHNATEGKFQWLNFEAFYSLGGDYFEIN